MRHFSWILAGTSLIGGTAWLNADDANPKQPPGSPVLEMLLKHFDKDGDGTLSNEEKAMARETLAKHLMPVDPDSSGPNSSGPGLPRGVAPEMIKRFDKDGDGKLNDEEMAVARKSREEMSRRNGPGPVGDNMPEIVMKRFDKDGDGKLNDQEKAAAKEAMANRGGNPFGRFNFEEVVKRFDKDGDGKLSAEEQATARAEFDKRRGDFNLVPGDGKPKSPKLDNPFALKKYDKDGDGKINDEEKAAALRDLNNLNKK